MASHTYTRISFWRNGQISQMVEVDLETRTPHQAKRYLRVWFLRMVSLEPDAEFIVRVQVGSQWEAA